MTTPTRHLFGKILLSSVILASTLLIQLGVDGQATVYKEHDLYGQGSQFSSNLVMSYSKTSPILNIHPGTTKQLYHTNLTKQGKRFQALKGRKQLGLTLFFLGIVGEKV